MGFSFAGANTAINRIREEARADKKAEQELISKRENTLLQLGLENKKTQSAADDKALRDAAINTRRLQTRIEELDLENNPELAQYYETLLSDPLAASDVMKFIKTQETEYERVVDLNYLPSLMKIIPNDQIPLQDRMDYVSMILNADLSDKKQFFTLADQIKNMTTGTPGRTVFTDIVPGSEIDIEKAFKKDVAQEKALGSYLRVLGNSYLRQTQGDATDQKTVDTKKFLDDLGATGPASDNLREEAIQGLFNYYMTPKELYELTNSSDNPKFRDFYNSPYITAMVAMYDYPVIDESEDLIKKMTDILRSGKATPKEILDFNLTFGKNAHEAYIP
tara:strand:- start:179 stop:1183 length:1005 start_codon:yes stop_codon:yes gene_type:complete